MNTKILLAAAFTVSLFVGHSAFAHNQGEQSDKSCGCGGKFQQMVQSLKLDANQQTKLQAIKDQTKASEKANWQQMKGIRTQIDQLIQSDNLDQTKLDSLINQKKELYGAKVKAKIMAKHQIYTLLTPQQKTQYQEFAKQWEGQPAAND